MKRGIVGFVLDAARRGSRRYHVAGLPSIAGSKGLTGVCPWGDVDLFCDFDRGGDVFYARLCAAGGEARIETMSKPLPDFSLVLMDGRRVSGADLRGKVVVIDFWATWCPPCREELPHLQALTADPRFAGKGLVVLAIDERERAQDIRSFLDASHIGLTVLQDRDGSVGRALSVTALPTTVVVGRDGMVRWVSVGYSEQSQRGLEAAIAGAM